MSTKRELTPYDRSVLREMSPVSTTTGTTFETVQDIRAARRLVKKGLAIEFRPRTFCKTFAGHDLLQPPLIRERASR